MTGLILRAVEVEGRRADVRIADGLVAEVGSGLTGGPELDGRGGALIPGLIDHHIHLLATAALADSVVLDDLRAAGGLAARIAAATQGRPPGAWVRATGYHERMAGLLDRDALDAIAPVHRLRVQHQTGSLWVLNSLALSEVETADAPEALERDAAGRATGRIWRGDAWLSARIGRTPPPLAPLGARLAAMGITGGTDASASTDAQAAAILAEAARDGHLPQRLVLMSAGPLAGPPDEAFAVGPLKILLDDHDLPDLDDMLARIGTARATRRPVAVHCVTAGELALTLAAFDVAGARPGDRVEHGGVIAPDAIPVLRRLGLTVVTQPGFVFERGDRYLAEMPENEHADLYRCASLLAAGVPTGASSDAPYGSPDPWAALRAAATRRTREGRPIAPEERVAPAVALDLFLGDPANPGGPPRRVTPGARADLCLLRVPLRDALAAPDAGHVAVTLVAGRIVHQAG